MMYSGGLKTLPVHSSDYEFDLGYIRRPLKPVYATDTSEGYNKYDAFSSVDLEWDDINKIDILYIMLSP
jgi:hypothetical protein